MRALTIISLIFAALFIFGCAQAQQPSQAPANQPQEQPSQPKQQPLQTSQLDVSQENAGIDQSLADLTSLQDNSTLNTSAEDAGLNQSLADLNALNSS